MKKFKITFIFMLILALAFALVGCDNDGGKTGEFMSIEEIVANAKALSNETGSSQNYEKTKQPNFTVPAGGYDGSKVEIKFYHTMGQNLSTVLEKYITESKPYSKMTEVLHLLRNRGNSLAIATMKTRSTNI